VWFENLPAVELARRLRAVPLFGFASVDELFRIAGVGRQVRHESGRTLYEEGAPADEILLLLEGKWMLEKRDGPSRQVEPPTVLGLEEVLEASAFKETLHSIGRSISLTLSAEEFRTLLSDNIELVQGLFRMLLGSRAGNGWPLILKGVVRIPPAPTGSPGLDPLARGLLLQEIPIFERATSEELLQLAAVSREVSVASGALLRPDNDAPALEVILSGEIVLDPPEGKVGSEDDRARPGDALGVYQVLAGSGLGRAARASSPARALRIEYSDLFGLLADDLELLQALFRSVFRAGRPGGAESR
jgi:CRP-like cAMP-binding protein